VLRGRWNSMCITRVGRAVSVSNGRARVEFFDGRALDDIDVSVVNAEKGEFVEVFGNLALSVLSASEARTRKKAWAEVGRAAMTAAGDDHR
jgi:hydrogenase maturation factor